MTATGKTSKSAVITAYFLIYVVWGSTYFIIGQALDDFPPFLLGALRFSVAGLLLLGWCLLKGEKVFRGDLIKKSVISGVILLFIDMAVIMLAQRYLSSSLVAIIAASTEIWIICFDVPTWKKNFRNPLVIVGVIIGFLGVMALYAEQLLTEQQRPHGEYGVAILIFGCISWSLGTMYAKYRSSKAEAVNHFAGSAWQMIAASAAFWLCSALSGDVGATDFAAVSVGGWLSLAYLIIFGSILAYTAYVWLLKVRPAAEVGTHAYVNPFVAVFMGITFGHEVVTAIQFIGLIIILLSVALISIKTGKNG